MQMLWHPDRLRTPQSRRPNLMPCKTEHDSTRYTNDELLPSCIWDCILLCATLALEMLDVRAKGMCIVSLLPPQYKGCKCARVRKCYSHSYKLAVVVLAPLPQFGLVVAPEVDICKYNHKDIGCQDVWENDESFLS